MRKKQKRSVEKCLAETPEERVLPWTLEEAGVVLERVILNDAVQESAKALPKRFTPGEPFDIDKMFRDIKRAFNYVRVGPYGWRRSGNHWAVSGPEGIYSRVSWIMGDLTEEQAREEATRRNTMYWADAMAESVTFTTAGAYHESPPAPPIGKPSVKPLTWEDVDNLRDVAGVRDSHFASSPPVMRLRDLADRLAALLPPRSASVEEPKS